MVDVVGVWLFGVFVVVFLLVIDGVVLMDVFVVVVSGGII